MKFFEYIKEVFPSMSRIKKTIREDRQHLFDIRSEMLWEKVYSSTTSGISSEHLCDKEVVVSLTTYGKRLFDVALAIESIMQGSVKPNRIVLWLDHSLEKKTLPVSLQYQIKRGLEISYCDDIGPYKKLIPSLKKFPESIIIVIDDDMIYNRDIVENLIRSYKDDPNMIHACRMHRITFKKDGSLDNYRNWQWQVNDDEITPRNFFTSGAGTLFPPHCFDEEIFNESVFMDICKYADDVWYNAMTLKNGIMIKKSFTHDDNGRDYRENMALQNESLFKINSSTTNDKQPTMNDIQLNSVYNRYGLLSKLTLAFKKDTSF